MKYNIFIILSILGLSGCKHSSDQQVYVQQEVQVFPGEHTLKLSDIFSSYKIISPKGPALASINDLILTDSILILKGRSDHSELHLYSSGGEYKNDLIATGRGNNEAFNVQTYRLVNSDTIEILANFSQKLFTYSLSQGKIIGQTNLPSSLLGSHDFIKYDNTHYVFFKPHKQLKGNEYKLNVFNSKSSQIEKQYFPLTIKDEYISFSQIRRLYSHKQKVLFYDVFAPGIYQIHSDSLSLYFAFNKGKFNFPATRLEKGFSNFDQFIENCQQSPYIWGHTDVSESNKYILSTFNYNDKFYLNVIDKTTLTSQSYTDIYDDMVTGETFKIEHMLSNISAKDSIQIFTLEPSTFKEIIKQKKENKKYDEYKNSYPYPCTIAEKAQEDDNSLIILFYEKS